MVHFPLKNEFFYKDQGLNRVKKLINIVQNNPFEYWFEQGIFKKKFSKLKGIYTIWNVVCRLEANTYWRSLPFVSSFNEKRSKLIKLKEELGLILDKYAKQNTSLNISLIKQ